MVKTSPSNTGSVGSIPRRGANIPHASVKNQNRKQKQYCNKFNKDFKNSPHQNLKIKTAIKLDRILCCQKETHTSVLRTQRAQNEGNIKILHANGKLEVSINTV